VTITDEGWHAVGMAATSSVDVLFDDAPATPVGAPSLYLAGRDSGMAAPVSQPAGTARRNRWPIGCKPAGRMPTLIASPISAQWTSP
jgi:hypothetical protein